MKTLAVSMILALGFAAPAFAEPPAPAPATTETTADAAPADALVIDEAAILEASPADHVKLLLKCSGPPPRLPKIAETKPASEPASTTNSGG
jgi:hypothetical protein